MESGEQYRARMRAEARSRIEGDLRYLPGETYVRYYEGDVHYGDTHMNASIPGVVIGDIEGYDVVTYQGKLVERLRPEDEGLKDDVGRNEPR